MGQTSETLIKPSRYLLEQNALTTRPAPRFLSQLAFARGDAGSDAVAASLRPIPLVGLVIELLDRAAETVDSDRAAAKDCITRASALLQREHSHIDRERGGATNTLTRGVLRLGRYAR